MMMSSQALTEAAALDLAGIEALAAELATLAGHEITTAFGTVFTVRYKTGLQDAQKYVGSARRPRSPFNPSLPGRWGLCPAARLA